MLINDVEIFVETVPGRGDLHFVLIHNAGGDHRFFIHQVEMLKKYGHVTKIDLPGHGASSSIPNCDIETLSGFIIEICKKLTLKNICLIGLNNGANVAIDVAAKNILPLRFSVLIDPPIFMDAHFITEIESFIEALEASDATQFIEALADNLFVRTEEKNREIARRAFLNADKKSLQTIFHSLIIWDRSSSLIVEKVSCKTLCIITDEHHCSYQRLKEHKPQFEIGKVIGSKCWATLEVPEQINAMIERFLQLY
jgi:pimeloyl-ACP methyl ester carboxylesterase